MYRLLVVGSEDRSCCSALTKEGFQVEVAQSSEEAAAKVRKERPDLVIVDVCFPAGKETEILESVRAEDPKVPIVVHAGCPMLWNDFRLWSADSCVEPTEDYETLKKAIHKFLPAEASGTK